jgi:signal transduction histidine kinase
VLARFGTGRVTFVLETDNRVAWLVFRVSTAARADDEFVAAIRVTESLMDRWEIIRSEKETVVTMARRLPGDVNRKTADELESIRADAARLTAGSAMDELAEHNRQLLATLAEVQAHRDELLELNSELAQTNQGVLALYGELSDEMEATNRGVVALYAELDQKNTEVRAASEAKTRFLANVSHELRSPVTSIVGLVRLLRDPASEAVTHEQGYQLEMINSSAHTLLTLVNELLDLAKAESGRLEPAPERVDLGEIFDTLRGTMRAVSVTGGTTLVVVDPDGVPPLHTDPVMLMQVLRNLISNGLKFTPAGEVRLRADADPGPGEPEFVRVTVADTGIGIPPDEHERVFEEFHQVRNNIQASVTGTGLGLPYARRLVTILGGTIALESVPGEGSTFTVRLPVGPVSTAIPKAGRSTSVLVVDDDEGFRTAAGGVLRNCGFTVFAVADGRTALTTARVRMPDMILLDLRLAELDGSEVLDDFAADPALAAIPVIVLTAYPQDLVGHAAAERTVAILDKTTTTLDDLCSVVRSTVGPHGHPDRRAAG